MQGKEPLFVQGQKFLSSTTAVFQVVTILSHFFLQYKIHHWWLFSIMLVLCPALSCDTLSLWRCASSWNLFSTNSHLHCYWEELDSQWAAASGFLPKKPIRRGHTMRNFCPCNKGTQQSRNAWIYQWAKNLLFSKWCSETLSSSICRKKD